MSGKPWATRPEGALCVACGNPARRHAQTDRAALYCSDACSRRYHRQLYNHRWYGYRKPERRTT